MILLNRRLALVAMLLASPAVMPASPDAWIRLDQQASAQYRSGDYASARTSAQQALSLAERHASSEQDQARLATSLNVLALIYEAQQRYGDAQPLLERALSISMQALPADHPNIAALRANLESLRKARHQHELALDARRAQDLNEQALKHHTLGEYQEAARLYEQALPIVEQHLGADSVEAARVLANLADTYEQRKDHARAAALYRRALDIYEEHADEAAAQATVLNRLASVHYIQRQYAKAAPLFKRSLQLMESIRGADHVDLLPMLDNLAALYLTTHRDDRAEEFLRRAATIRKMHGLEPR